MKPIPPGFCYVADNAVIPGRPWWHRDARRGRYVRRGGSDFSEGYDSGPLSSTDGICITGGWRDRTPDQIDAEAERIDREHPLPHPGCRVGQVWLHPKYGALSVLCIDEDGIPMAYIGITQASTNGDGILTIWGPDVYRLCRVNLEACWLLFDPLMPHLAPWGPKEGP